MDIVQKIRSGTGRDQERILCNMGCVYWYIWKARNQYIFQQTNINPEQVIINAEYLAAEYHNTTRGSSTEHISSNGRIGDRKRITWRPPPQDRLKVNTDAAFHRDTGKAASAVVVRNWRGKIVTGTTSKFITTSALAAKKIVIIETDCLPLVQAVKARTPIAKVDAILRDILQLLEEAPAVGATWTPKKGNIVVHQLAAMAVKNVLRSQWTFNTPTPVRNTIKTEARFAIIQHNQWAQNQINGRIVAAETSRPEAPRRIHHQWRQYRAGEENGVCGDLRMSHCREELRIPTGKDASGFRSMQQVGMVREVPAATTSSNREQCDEDDISVRVGH
ncbi:hypothetical protein Ahy_B03g068605 [Arachis hypogaea]|uniref:RNase H type-1 domain-containing protein n=1 Tax=Arachis hypogaea TaxID=3818 RepID=A0A445AAF5_ARAHY|nr:hypothetical protein Ahy_B03g068605 [Arachis hypogaea]